MRRLLPVQLLVFCSGLLFFSVTSVWAVGIGVYVGGGVGSADWTFEDENTGREADIDSDNKRGGIGFVLDTNVAGKGIFNYRLQLGYEKWKSELDSGDETDLAGFAMTNDFGFGVVRTPYVRIWLGPELKFSYLTGHPDGQNDFDIHLFRFGIGPALGANFNIGSTVTLALKTGYLFEGFFGAGDNDTGTADETYRGTSNEFFVNFAILFRFDDGF